MKVSDQVNLGDRSCFQNGVQLDNLLPNVEINTASGQIFTLPNVVFSGDQLYFWVYNHYVHQDSVIILNLLYNPTGYNLITEVTKIKTGAFQVRISHVQYHLFIACAILNVTDRIKLGFLVC